MKKLIIFALVAMAVASCSSEDETRDPGNSPVEIKLNAGVTEIQTKAPVNAGTSITAQFVASATSGDYTTNKWSDTATFTAAASPGAALSFSTPRYYPINGDTVYIKGYYPVASLSGKTVTFTGTDGTKDVMITAQQKGTKKTSGALAFVFNHLLTQLQFKFVAGTGYTATGITVTSVTIKSQKTPLTLDLNTGTIATYNPAADLTISGNYPIDGTTAADCPMVKSGEAITLSVTTSDGVTYPDASVTNVTTVAGSAHVITLTFTPLSITATATVAAWNTGGTGSSTLQ